MNTSGSVASGAPPHLDTPLARRIAAELAAQGGWLGFERFMELALYAPGLGYYARGDRQFGSGPATGSDFVTAPELSPLFGRALARQVSQALEATGTHEVWEFGAGSGALAAQLLGALGGQVQRYVIVDLSAMLRERQRATLAAALPPGLLARVQWVDALPARWSGVAVGNEVLDAMPVVLLHFDGRQWLERGVALHDGRWVWSDRPTALRPPVSPHAQPPAPPVAGPPGAGPWPPGTTTELGRHAEGFIRTLAAGLQRGAAFLIDYGFPAHEYYHPQRTGGTLMCHQAHRADTDPLADVGAKDITAHVDFSAIALAAQDAGLAVLGYTSQAHFLVNCGLLDDLRGADARTLAPAQKLLAEHEMGELFKVIALAPAGCVFEPMGFARGDRTHTL